MAELINVGVVTEAQGPHLEAYLSSLAAADGVELVALVDPSEKSFEKARVFFEKATRRLQTFRDEREMIQAVHPKLTVVTLPAFQAPGPIQLAHKRGKSPCSQSDFCLL
jgi:hypothetical protein